MHQQQFYDWRFDHNVPKEIQQQIKEHGIPYKLWDEYEKKYNYRIVPQFYKEDSLVDIHNVYFNGEETFFYQEELSKKLFYNRPLPHNAGISLGKYWCDAYFDWDEISAAFKTLSKDNKDA